MKYREKVVSRFFSASDHVMKIIPESQPQLLMTGQLSR